MFVDEIKHVVHLNIVLKEVNLHGEFAIGEFAYLKEALQIVLTLNNFFFKIRRSNCSQTIDVSENLAKQSPYMCHVENLFQPIRILPRSG